MNRWFEVTVKGERDNIENGEHQKVTEKYLFDALSYTEAESRATEKMTELFPSFMITKINPIKLSEIFFDGKSDYWFKCKINYITINEKNGKEKKTPAYMWVQASDTKSAEENLKEGMKGTMDDWVIESIAETKIIEAYKYDLTKGAESLSDKTEPVNY